MMPITADSHKYQILRTLSNYKKNTNTERVKDSYVQLFIDWLKQSNEFRSPLSIEFQRWICTVLGSISAQCSKANGKENLNDDSNLYELSTPSGLHSSIFRYLRGNDYKYNIKQHIKFRHSRAVLAAKMKELKQMGKGNRRKAADSFSSELSKPNDMNMLGKSKFTSALFILMKVVHD